MLMFAGSELGGWHSSPMSTPAGNYENMALESFLFHSGCARLSLPDASENW